MDFGGNIYLTAEVEKNFEPFPQAKRTKKF